MLPPDEFKTILLSGLGLALAQTEKRRMSPFRAANHVRGTMKTVFAKLKGEGHLEMPWLVETPPVALLADMVNTRSVAGYLEADVEAVMEALYPPEFAHRFPASAKKGEKPKLPPAAGGRFVDVSD